MREGQWIKDLPAAVTVCDREGIILEMNEKSGKMFEKTGGRKLLGSNLLDCHPGPAREKLAEMLKNQATNCYTIEKNGAKKMIYQTPWYDGGEYRGFVEFVFEIPLEMPHYERKG